jgi:hypothetical protein
MGGGAASVVWFYNLRGTAERWIKEGKNAVKWTKLSCHDFVDNQVVRQTHARRRSCVRSEVLGVNAVGLAVRIVPAPAAFAAQVYDLVSPPVGRDHVAGFRLAPGSASEWIRKSRT